MQSTFAPIELGKRGLVATTQGLQTVGHNLSNASVEGYSRQRVEMVPSPPLYEPQLNREETPGQIGQGVEVSRIERIKDMLLEGRIVSEQNVQGYWEARDKYILMLEQVYNEPTDHSVRDPDGQVLGVRGRTSRSTPRRSPRAAPSWKRGRRSSTASTPATTG